VRRDHDPLRHSFEHRVDGDDGVIGHAAPEHADLAERGLQVFVSAGPRVVEEVGDADDQGRSH
jgi:hypothetical protein